MKKAFIRQWICLLLIFIGIFGLFINYKLFIFVPIGFLGCLINSIFTSLYLGSKGDKLIDKLGE